MRIIGLDLSLTATGIATIDGDTIDVSTVRSSGAKDASLSDRASRINRLVDQIVALSMPESRSSRIWRETGRRLGVVVGAPRPDLVVIEQPAFSRTTGHHHDRSGLWWQTVTTLLEYGVPVVEVTPSGLKKYATGKGNADKDTVLLAVARRFPDVEIRNNNEADALVLAAMGADHLGCPIGDMPAVNRAALDAVRWPEAVTA